MKVRVMIMQKSLLSIAGRPFLRDRRMGSGPFIMFRVNVKEKE